MRPKLWRGWWKLRMSPRRNRCRIAARSLVLLKRTAHAWSVNQPLPPIHSPSENCNPGHIEFVAFRNTRPACTLYHILSSSYSSSCGKPRWNLPHFAQSTSTASLTVNSFTRPPNFLSPLKNQHTRPCPLTFFCQLGITNPNIVPWIFSKLFCSVSMDLKAPSTLKDIGVFRPMLNTSSWILDLEVPGAGFRRCVG